MGIMFITRRKLEKYKKEADNSELKRTRIFLHNSTNDPVQSMIIIARIDTDIPTHKHPKNKPESYTIIEGEMDVIFYDDNSNVINKIHLDRNKPVVLIKPLTWHKPVPTTEYVVYHEIYVGPFEKEKDVIFLNKNEANLN